MLQDLLHAGRVLLRTPGFTLVAVLTLSIGIGANTAIFSIVNGVLLRPLSYPEPDRIVRLWEQTDRGTRVAVSYPNFLEWREQSTGFEVMAAYQGGRETVLGGREPVFANVYRVTDGFFRVFGVEPVIGRTFIGEEVAFGGAPAVVVSHIFWRQSLGAAPDLESVQVQVRGLLCRVVGVMPPGFAYPAGAEVWIPKELFEDTSGRSGHNNAVVARLNDGVSLEAADAQIDAVAARIRAQRPDTGPDASDAEAVTVVPLHEALTGGSRDALLTLLAAVGFVLLIACVNVASTLLARGEERRKELAIRAALGATRARLVRQLLTENLLLAAAGAAGGLLLAAWIVRALLAVNPTALPRPDAVEIDSTVLIFALALAALTPLLFGLFPSVQVARTELRESLAEGARASASPSRARARNVLISAEVAVALMLLAGSALLIRSFWNVVTAETGFDGRGIVTADLALPGSKYPDDIRAAEFYHELLVRIRAVPGVQAAGAINTFPLSGADSSGTFVFAEDSDPSRSEREASYRVVTPGYFEAMRVPLLKGRFIGDQDAPGAQTVVVVNEDFVRRYVPDGEPLGRRFRYLGMDSLDEPWMIIVGVVGNVKHASLVRDVVPEAYVSSLQRPRRPRFGMTLAIRPEQAALAATLVPTLRQEIRRSDPEVPVEFSSFEERLGRSVADRRFTMMVLASFGGVALLLAAIGIYGVLGYSVAQRTQEIGIRMALGADRQSVVALMLRDALGWVGAGILVGVAAAGVATRALRSFLFGVDASDPLAFAAAVLVLSAVAWLAGYIPARRATRVDPLVALRAQ